MSKLYYSDRGFANPNQCEEVSANRRASKRIELPSTDHPAHLFILARPHAAHLANLHQTGTAHAPLLVSINGRPLPSPSIIGDTLRFAWYQIEIPAVDLRIGQNRIEIWSTGDGMSSWTLAMETNLAGTTNSSISFDGGQSWVDDRLGINHRSRGEYVVRIRLAEGQDPHPPTPVYEDFSHPRLTEIRRLIPAQIASAPTTLERCRGLLSWTAQSWEYCSSAYASLYTPWDAMTILKWGRRGQGQNGQRPIVMCVHYAVVFITACQALGIYARPLAFTGAINSFDGHFAAEVWIPELSKWVFVDPNLDAMFFKNGVPLSVLEMRAVQNDLQPYVQFGPGYTYQNQNPAIQEFMHIYLNGRFMQRCALWPRTDFLSHPELTPPAHGALAYCEAGFVWEPGEDLGMFPFFGDPDYFTAGPCNPNVTGMDKDVS